jgi:hypothetical protein
MNGDLLGGLVVGIFIGGVVGTLLMAVVAAGSRERPTRAPREATWASAPRAAATASPSERMPSRSSMRVDLLLDLEEGSPQP